MNELRTLLENVFTNTLNLNNAVASLLTTLVVILIWVGIAMIFSRFLKNAIQRMFNKKEKGKRNDTLSDLTYSTVKVLIWFVVIMVIISELGFDITPILAGAGILGLAVGFGAQHLVSNVIAGFFIIADNAYNVGETVEIDGFRGKVKYLNLRATHLENWLGSVMIINNGKISKVINWSRNDTVAVVEFGVAYETDLEKVQQIMPELLEQLKEKIEDIIEMPTFLGVSELADSSINMRISAKTKNGTHFAVERKIRHELVLYLNKHSIEIPFPQVVVSNKEKA